MRESEIVYEGRFAWVCRERDRYTVYRIGATHSVSDSAYPKTDDGLTIALARAKYLNGARLLKRLTHADAGHPDNVIL